MTVRCPLCGHTYDPAESRPSACHGCGRHGCPLVRCPNCGYETTPPAPWHANLHSIFGGHRKHLKHRHRHGDPHHDIPTPGHETLIPLSDLAEGQEAVVAAVRTDDPEILDRLMAMMVYPGSRIRVVQTSPAHVFEIGRSRFALDRELASAVTVRLIPSEASRIP